VIVPAGYEMLNGGESNSCAGIEVASAVLLRALRATPDEGVRGYIFVWSRWEVKTPTLSRKERETRMGHPRGLDVFQPNGSACRFYFGEPTAREIEDDDC
jgi:hypothetical protein